MEIPQKQTAELKNNALTVESDFDEIKKVGERLTAVRRKLNLQRKPVTQDEIIAALSDGIEVFADKINLTLLLDALKDLAEKMSTGFFHSTSLRRISSKPSIMAKNPTVFRSND